MPESDGLDDEWFVYVVTAGVEAVREGEVVVDSEREAPGGRQADREPPSESPR